ncbi:MAG: adenosylcobinamide-GDP ribazoletransferase [Bacillota bacterium]
MKGVRIIFSQLKAAGFALTFLTRIQLPVTISYEESLPSRSLPYFPVIGLVLGALLVGLDFIFRLIWPEPLAAALLLASYVYLTGALHLDGLLDTVDGIFSGRPKEKMLEIMKDSLNGSFATVTAVIYLLLKFVLLWQLAERFRLPALLIFPVLSRWFVLFVISAFARAENSSLGRGFEYSLTRLSLGQAAVVPGLSLILLGLLGQFSPFQIGLIIGVTFLVILFIAKSIEKKIGGLTGDIYGMINEMAELVILLIITAF